MLWRRSFDVPPPPLADDSEFSQVNDPRYADIDGDDARAPSRSSSSSTGCCRTGRATSRPTCASGKTVLVTAHGNSLRGLVKHLDGISDADIAELNIPTGIPLVYELNEDFTPVTRGGKYLDAAAAADAIKAVANQGRH